jgi:membrane protein
VSALRWSRRYVWQPARETALEWYRDSAPRWSAAIAFYTVFSLAPVLVVSIAIASFFWDDAAVRSEVLRWFDDLLGERGARQIEAIIDRSLPEESGLRATIIGVGVLLAGATVVFSTLRSALNAVWGVENAGSGGVWGFVRGRLMAATLLVGLAILIVASLVASTIITGWGAALEGRLPVPLPLVRIGDLVASFALLGVLFAAIFKWLPDVVITWRDVRVGASITALLFVIGKVAIGYYLGHIGIASAYGVAGSVILLLLWVYYSAMIFLLGAEATQVYARHWGSRIVPAARRRRGRRRRSDGFVEPIEKE